MTCLVDMSISISTVDECVPSYSTLLEPLEFVLVICSRDRGPGIKALTLQPPKNRLIVKSADTWDLGN